MRNWTVQERLKQSQLIREWEPWKQSTGATTTEGKLISKMNAYKTGAFGSNLQSARTILTQCTKLTRDLLIIKVKPDAES